MSDGCIFCEFAQGTRSASVIYEDELTMAFVDMRQFHPGHALVIPREHFADAFQEVPHLHIHVHPRKMDDGFLRVYPGEPPTPGRATMDAYAARIREHL